MKSTMYKGAHAQNQAKLQRQMFRAMSQLERIQRMRQGEAVPPPMTMEVAERP